jgi:hypothetical protein
MAIKLSSNPTCVLSDADNLTAEQRQKINMNLTRGIPGSDIEGDKVTVINSEGEVEMKAYSAGGGGGTSYTAGNGIDISGGYISAKVDHETIDYDEYGQLQSLVGTGPSGGYTTIDYQPGVDDRQSFFHSIEAAMSSNLIPVVRLEYPRDGGYKYVSLVLSSYNQVNREGPSDYEYWFVGSTFEPDENQQGTLRHMILKAAYYGESDNYEVHQYTTVQNSVSYT